MTSALDQWLSQAVVTQAVYTPSELERISGLGTDMQRVWRRRGQLPPLKTGHARFTIPEAIEISFRYALSKAGIPPSEMKLDLSGATSAAIFHAIFAHGGCEVIGPADEIDDFLQAFAEDQGELGMLLAGSPAASSYLVIDEWHQTRIVDDPQQLISDNEELNIIFNLALVGARLVERGRKPVISLRLANRPGTREVRRLTGVGANDS